MRWRITTELEAFSRIRGSYRLSPLQKFSQQFFVVMCAVAAVWFSSFYFLPQKTHPRQHHDPMSVALGAMFLAAAIVFWRQRDLEYEFTGEEVIQRCAGRERKRIRISDIIEIRPSKDNTLILKTDRAELYLCMSPSLKSLINQETATVRLTKSEEEQRRFNEGERRAKKALMLMGIIGFFIVLNALLYLFLHK